MKTLTVKELRQVLADLPHDFPEDAKVMVAGEYLDGDNIHKCTAKIAYAAKKQRFLKMRTSLYDGYIVQRPCPEAAQAEPCLVIF